MSPSPAAAPGLAAVLFLGLTLALSQRPRALTWRTVLPWLGSAVLGALALAASVDVDVRWITAVALVGALGTLGDGGALTRQLAPPVVVLGAVGLVQHLAEPWWAAGLALALLVGAASLTGRRLRAHLEHPTFVDLAVMVALATGSLLIAPELLRGWDRAAVAAEVSTAPALQADAPWAVAIVAIALAASLLWGLRPPFIKPRRRNVP